MSKLKNYLGLITLAVFSYINIAAIQAEENIIDNINSSFSCAGNWEVVDIPHFACSGSLRNCVEGTADHHNCMFIFWIGSPDIVVME